MSRRLPVVLVLAVLVAAALQSAAPAAEKLSFALSGEGRALEVAVANEGVTLGVALAKVDSAPSALGIAAAQCELLGDNADPTALPCSEAQTEQTKYPGNPGDDTPTCAGALPEPINTLVRVELACGSSQSGASNGIAWTRNEGSVAKLSSQLPTAPLLPDTDAAVDQLVDQLTTVLQPVLDQTPQEVQDAVETVVGALDAVEPTDLVEAEIGVARSDVLTKGTKTTVASRSAAARVGILALPTQLGEQVSDVIGTPLDEGLVIIEVGQATADATIDRTSATAASTASPALVTVKVRDITKPEPTYVTVSVAPGETVTVLQGTPAESTITAAAATTKQSKDSAMAAADAVRLHLLKGVQGGIQLGLGRTTAAASVERETKTLPKPPQTRPKTLPSTGGTDLTLPAIAMLAAATGLWVVRRRAGAR